LYITLFNRGYAGAMGWQWYNYPDGAEGVVNWPRMLTNTQRLFDERRSAVDVNSGFRLIYFEANPPEVERGDASELTWSVSGAASVTLDGVAVEAKAMQQVAPEDTTTYTLVAISPAAGDSVLADTLVAHVTVTVVEPGPAQAPVVVLSLPGEGTVVRPGFGTTVGVEAADPDGASEQVECFADGVSIGVAENPPWNMQWTNVEAGEYQLTAVATDDDGLTATSESWVVYGLNTL